MDEMNCFCILCNKNIIIRRESKYFITFDPIALEFYEINDFGACILYLLSKKISYNQIIDYIQDWFSIERNSATNYIQEFITNFPMKKQIFSYLLDLGVPIKCLY